MQFAALRKSRFRALKTNTCEYPLCDVQIYKPEHYCTEHERLFTKLHAEHQAVLLLVCGVTSENIVQYWQLPENVKHAIRVEAQDGRGRILAEYVRQTEGQQNETE